jgi:hypothetical protein
MAGIFNTQEEIKEVFSAPNIGNELGSIKSYLDTSAITYVQPYLSVAQWDKLVTDFEEGVSTEPHTKLLQKVRAAIIHFAYLLYADDGDMQISDSGFTRLEGDGEKTAYSGQIQKFKRARLRDGWNAIEDMLRLLQSDKSTYNLWAASDEYKNIKSFFIWNTNEYRKYRSIKNLGVLDALEGCTVSIQDDIIRTNIGDELYALLKTELAADNFSADNKLIIPFINKAIAHLIVERGMDEGLIQFSDEGVSIISFEDKERGGMKIDPADIQRYSIVKSEAKKKGDSAIKELRNFLNKNASVTKYPTYFTSELYDDPTDNTNKQTFQNKTGGTFFAR